MLQESTRFYSFLLRGKEGWPMEFEEYKARISSLPVEQLHTLVEENPELAIAWAEAEEAQVAAWSKAHEVEIDERAKDELLARLMRRIRQNGRNSQRKA